MPQSPVDAAIETLQQRKQSMRCDEVVTILEELGFDVNTKKSPGHKVYTHRGLTEFTSGGINCDHGKNPQIKTPYIINVIRVLRTHKAELEKLLGEKP